MSDTLNLANSIWPNGMKVDSDGHAVFYPLGTNKVNVPTSSSEWPKGNKLISPFVYQGDKLVGFCDTKAMIVSDKTSITLNYEHIEADFSSIEEGMLTVTAPNATTLKCTWSKSSNTGNSGDTIMFKYKGCKTVDDIKAVDTDYKTNDIVDGTWNELLCDLEDGKGMFWGCSNLTNFTSDLSSLTNGNVMFNNCSNLATFTSDLSSLTAGEYMFGMCSNLTNFTSDLSSLTNGNGMFSICKLNASSVKNIIVTINRYPGILFIGMGCNNTIADKNLFAQEVGYSDMTSLLAAFQAKGWTVTANYNGRPTTTYSLRRPSEDTLPVFVKLEETEDHTDYTSEDGSKKYILNYFHETTGSTDGYTQFNSLEEAIESLNIKPIENQ